MESPGEFLTPRAHRRLSPGSPRGDVDEEVHSSDSGGASSSTTGSPRVRSDDLDAGGLAGSKAFVSWSPSSAATTARSPSVPAMSWSARSSISDSPIAGSLRQPPSRSFASLDPEITSCLAKPLLEAPGLVCRTYWESLFVVLPMYTGYAALFGLQHEIKAVFGIEDDDSVMSYNFSAAVSCMYVWSFIVRMGHSVVLGFITTRARAYVAMVSMLLAVLLIAVVIIALQSHRICWVVLAYSLGGIGIGCFESSFLSCLTPLGHETKHFAILGIPTGITLVNVGGFFLMGPPFFVSPTAIYLAVAALIACGMLVMALRIPKSVAGAAGRPSGGEDNGVTKLLSDLGEFRAWLPQVWHYAFAFTLDMLTLSAFCPGVVLYVYDKETVTLAEGLTLPTSSFISVVSTFNMFGGVTGRWLSYRMRPRHPICYAVFTFAGVLVILQWVPLLAPFGTFLVMMGDGLIYGSISRHIDSGVPRQFNLTAISFWLLVGDIGSIMGSSLIYSIRCWAYGQ
mmetsp:Transcript_64073/g.198419  ORF Transcript_64073/g.198419 Transcript_64073/m.198419 type:complete len:510 (-) Transcript_64073:183-1712(-)